jgi:hypothetical protein
MNREAEHPALEGKGKVQQDTYGTNLVVKGAYVKRLQSPSSPMVDPTKGGRLKKTKKKKDRTASRRPVVLVVAIVILIQIQRL